MNDASDISLGLAFAAGLVSFLSPCVLPLVPSYLTFVSGMTLQEITSSRTAVARSRSVLHAALFVLGFSLVFVSLGAAATVVGAALRGPLLLIQRVGGVMIVIFGLMLLGVVRAPFLLRERRVHPASRPAGIFGSVVVGAAFGAGWTPCVGPVLASILLLAGSEGSMSRGTSLLALYSLGLGLPFIAAAFGMTWFLERIRGMRRWLGAIERASGALLVLAGILLATGRFSVLTSFLASFGQLITLEVR